MTSLSYTREDAAQSFAAMSHLRLGSPQENIEDAKAEGIRLGSKLKPAQVLEIVALKRKHGIKNWVLAERFSAGDTPCHFQQA